MLRVIHKYPLQVFGFDYSEVSVPLGDVVAVGFQHGILHAWVDRDIRDTLEIMYLVMVPTGREFDDTDMRHVGSAVSEDYVWHVYRRY